jgi:hypothetical protein
MKAKDKTKIAANKMTFIRRTAKCTQMEYKGNEDMLKEAKALPVL